MIGKLRLELVGGGHPYDGWWTEKQLSDEDKEVFHGWQEYQGKRDVLNPRRLATSYNRPGMQGVKIKSWRCYYIGDPV